MRQIHQRNRFNPLSVAQISIGRLLIEYNRIYFINNFKSINFYNDCWKHVSDCRGEQGSKKINKKIF